MQIMQILLQIDHAEHTVPTRASTRARTVYHTDPTLCLGPATRFVFWGSTVPGTVRSRWKFSWKYSTYNSSWKHSRYRWELPRRKYQQLEGYEQIDASFYASDRSRRMPISWSRSFWTDGGSLFFTNDPRDSNYFHAGIYEICAIYCT